MKRINKYLALCLSLIIFIGCDNNFDNINTNPEATEDVPASMLATYLVNEIMRKNRYVKEYAEDGVLAKQITWNEGVSNQQYNRLGRVRDLSNHLIITNCNDMVSKAPGDKGYQGLALFAKAYKLYYSSLDLGDIPYSEAGKGEEGVMKPKYDTQKEVMLSILNDLEEAYKCFSEANETAFDGDIVFDGNRNKWKTTITAFQLKVLINLSKKESDSELNIKSRFASIVQSGSLMASNADNFQHTYKDQANMQYPFNDLTSNQCKYAMLSSVIVDMLKELNDYRLFYYAEPSIAKTKAGISDDSFDAYVGVDPSIPFGEVSKAHGDNLFCAPNLRYTSSAHPEGEPLIRLGYGEQQLILAEACLRGWISGDVATYYKKGIEANMTFTRDATPNNYAHNRVITDDYIASYLSETNIQLTGSFESDLNKVISQKYLASFLQYTYEAYYDYRRTGYPTLPINPETSLNVAAPDKMPIRYMYPENEYAYNRENLEEALQRQFSGSDDINDVMWILQ